MCRCLFLPRLPADGSNAPRAACDRSHAPALLCRERLDGRLVVVQWHTPTHLATACVPHHVTTCLVHLCLAVRLALVHAHWLCVAGCLACRATRARADTTARCMAGCRKLAPCALPCVEWLQAGRPLAAPSIRVALACSMQACDGQDAMAPGPWGLWWFQQARISVCVCVCELKMAAPGPPGVCFARLLGGNESPGCVRAQARPFLCSSRVHVFEGNAQARGGRIQAPRLCVHSCCHNTLFLLVAHEASCCRARLQMHARSGAAASLSRACIVMPARAHMCLFPIRLRSRAGVLQHAPTRDAAAVCARAACRACAAVAPLGAQCTRIDTAAATCQACLSVF